MAIDFSENVSPGSSQYNKIHEAINALNIGILINNVGRSYDHAEYFTNTSDETIRSVMDINMESVVYMTQLILPKMVSFSLFFLMPSQGINVLYFFFLSNAFVRFLVNQDLF